MLDPPPCPLATSDPKQKQKKKKEKTPDDKPMHDAAIRNQSYGSRPWPRPPPSRLPRLRFHDIFWNGPRVGGMKKFAALPSDNQCGIIPPAVGPGADAAGEHQQPSDAEVDTNQKFRSSKLSRNARPFFPAPKYPHSSVICGRAAHWNRLPSRKLFWEPNATKEKFKLPPHIRSPKDSVSL